MPGRHGDGNGATASSLFCGSRRRGKPQRRGGGESSHVPAIPQPSDSGSGGGGRRPTADAQRPPAKPCFVMGFLTGHELSWMPEALRILRDELPNIDVMISSQYSPLLADGLSKGKIDAAFLRREKGVPDLAFRSLVKEPLIVGFPGDHRLAALKSIGAKELAGETFVIVSHTAPVLREIINNYLKRSRINITPAHEADHVTMGISLIMSTRGVGLLPAYAQNFLPASVTSRPLKGDAPTVDLVLGYRKSNQSPILKLLLSRLDE